MQSKLLEDKEKWLTDTDRITRILDIRFDEKFREPMAEVMVVDSMSDDLGTGVEKKKYIVAGDLSRASIRQMLEFQFVQSNQVCPCYFDDFFENVPERLAEIKQKKE